MAGNIKEYEVNAGTEAPFRPDEHGAEVMAQAGRIVAERASQTGERINHAGVELQEGYDSSAILSGTKAMAQMEQDHQQQWHDFMNSDDAGDPAKVQAFRQKLDQQADDTLSNISGNGLASDRVTTHFAEQVGRYKENRFNRETADLSTYAGIQADKQLSDVMDKAHNIAESDVDGIEPAFNLLDSSVVAMQHNPYASFEQKAKYEKEIDAKKKELIIDNGLGRIERGARLGHPEAAIDDIQNGELSEHGTYGRMLDAKQRAALLEHANGAQNGVHSDIRFKQEQGDRQVRMAAEDEEAKIMSTFTRDPATGRLRSTPTTLTEVMANRTLMAHPETYKATVDMVDRLQKNPTPATDWGIMRNLISRIGTADAPSVNEIRSYVGRGEGGLTTENASWLENQLRGHGPEAEMENKGINNAIAFGKAHFVGDNLVGGMGDDKANRAFNDWTQSFLNDYSTQRAAGAKAIDLLTSGGKGSLVSKEYFDRFGAGAGGLGLESLANLGPAAARPANAPPSKGPGETRNGKSFTDFIGLGR